MEKKFTPKTLREIKTFDTFEISKDFFNGSKIPKDYKMKPVFNEGVIKISSPKSNFTNKNDVFYIYLNSINGDIEVYVYSRENYKFQFFFSTVMNDSVTSVKDLKIYKSKDFDYIEDRYFISFITNVILEAMAYISYFTENKDTVIKHGSHKRTTSSGASNKGEKNNNRRKIQVLNKEKVVYEVSTDNAELSKSLRKYKRHTEAWHVMGHKRTYKSGKVVWVKPYTKGTKKAENSVEAKKYIIENKGGN